MVDQFLGSEIKHGDETKALIALARDSERRDSSRPLELFHCRSLQRMLRLQICRSPMDVVAISRESLPKIEDMLVGSKKKKRRPRKKKADQSPATPDASSDCSSTFEASFSSALSLGSSMHRTHKPRRSVRFATDEDGALLTTTHNYARNVSPKKRSQVFMGPQEVSKQQKSCSAIGKEAAKTQRDVVDSIHRLLGMPPELCTNRSLEEAAEVVSASSLRGLERYATPIVRQQRKLAIRDILSIQTKAKAKYPEKVEALLRVKSVQVTKRAREYALMIARSDCTEAMKFHRESPS